MFNERDIYQYTVEGRQVYGDPLFIYRKLQEVTGGQLNRLVTESKADDPSRYTAQSSLIEASRKIFGAAPLDPKTGQGVTDAEVWKLLADFLGGLDDLRKKPKTLPTSTEPTEDLRWRDVTTEPSSDSYLTSLESVPNEPTRP